MYVVLCSFGAASASLRARGATAAMPAPQTVKLALRDAVKAAEHVRRHEANESRHTGDRPKRAAAERPAEAADAAQPSAQHQAAADLPTAPREMLKRRMVLRRLQYSIACDEKRGRHLELALLEQALRQI